MFSPIQHQAGYYPCSVDLMGSAHNITNPERAETPRYQKIEERCPGLRFEVTDVPATPTSPQDGSRSPTWTVTHVSAIRFQSPCPASPTSPTLTEGAHSPTHRMFSPAPMGPTTPNISVQTSYRQIGRPAAAVVLTREEHYLKPFRKEEWQEIRNEFSREYADLMKKRGISLSEVKFSERVFVIETRSGTKTKVALIAQAFIGQGGNAKVYFGAVHGKNGELKYRAFRHSKRSALQCTIEDDLSGLEKRMRPIQKVQATSDKRWRVMELAQEGDLSHFMKKHPRIDLGLRIQLVQQVLHVYNQFHLMGYVHRDIKGLNFVVNRNSDGLRVRLSDLDTAKEHVQGLQENLRVGTEFYWPKDRRCINPFAADCYALGLTMLDMCIPKFLDSMDDRLTVPEFLEQNREKIYQKIPPVLCEFVDKCLYDYKKVGEEDFEQVLDRLSSVTGQRLEEIRLG